MKVLSSPLLENLYRTRYNERKNGLKLLGQLGLFFFQVTKDPLVEACKCDRGPLPLKAMPQLSEFHLYPNAFGKMGVNLAFHLFSEQVQIGLKLDKSYIVKHSRNVEVPRFITKLSVYKCHLSALAKKLYFSYQGSLICVETIETAAMWEELLKGALQTRIKGHHSLLKQYPASVQKRKQIEKIDHATHAARVYNNPRHKNSYTERISRETSCLAKFSN